MENVPEREQVKTHLAVWVERGPMSPKLIVRDGDIIWFLIWVPIIWKLTSNPFSLSIISGCEEVILSDVAVPYPSLEIKIPRTKGTAGSIAMLQIENENLVKKKLQIVNILYLE